MRSLHFLLGLCLISACGCGGKPAPSIILATTTSVQDTGLLDMLLPKFREQNGIEVKPVAVGTGQALAIARRGDADVLIVHDPDSEKRFMDEGHGETRRLFMHNYFIIVGPSDDPARVRGAKTAAEAFKRIAAKQATFVSRGDESGTHLREKSIWKKADIEPQGGWYVRGGAGMGAVLRVADEKRGYTLTDRGTYLALHEKLDLAVLLEGDPLLLNVYSVIVVNADQRGAEARKRARQFAEFLIAPETQKAIGEFGVERFGQPLFIPDAVAHSKPSQ